MITHRNVAHKENIKIHTLEFHTFDDFLEWKQEKENANDTAYVQQCAPKITSNATKVWYYYCNRAGAYRQQGDGKRLSKQFVTNKISNQCTAHIRAEVDLNTVYVRFCCAHYNHQIELCHIYAYLPRNECRLPASYTKASQWSDIRDSVQGNLHRHHITTKQDLQNIKHQYNIDGLIRHPNGVNAWVDGQYWE